MTIDLPAWLPLVGLVSLFCFLAALPALPWIIRSLPEDIFLRARGKEPEHPLLRVLLILLRNLAGVTLFLMGFVMLFIPGQGLLTMLAGLVIMKFPGKSGLVRRMLAYEKLQKGLNGLRGRLGREPFRFPEPENERPDLD